MADPGTQFNNRNVPTHSVGPYQFEVPTLAPGDAFTLDLREYEENGTKGYYTVLSEAGYDSVEIINESTHRLAARVNDVNTYVVVANSIRSISSDGAYRIRVTNEGTGNAENIVISIMQSGMDADQQAKRQAGESPVRRVIRNFTGL